MRRGRISFPQFDFSQRVAMRLSAACPNPGPDHLASARKIVVSRGFNSMLDAFNYLNEGRPHGGDWLAEAAHVVLHRMFGYARKEWEKVVSADKIVDFVARALACAESMMAESGEIA